MTDSERNLIDACKRGESDAYRRLYDMYKDRVYSTTLRTLGNGEDAEDALQETFVKAFRSIGKFEGKSSFSTWIYRIAFNTAIEIVRKRKKHDHHLDIDEYADILAGDSLKDHTPVQQAVEEELQNLPEGYRRVFVLHATEGFKHHEIAKMLGISVGTSKSQYYQARIKMRKLLSNQLKELKYGLQ